jgi:hypothetical protein
MYPDGHSPWIRWVTIRIEGRGCCEPAAPAAFKGSSLAPRFGFRRVGSVAEPPAGAGGGGGVTPGAD